MWGKDRCAQAADGLAAGRSAKPAPCADACRRLRPSGAGIRKWQKTRSNVQFSKSIRAHCASRLRIMPGRETAALVFAFCECTFDRVFGHLRICRRGEAVGARLLGARSGLRGALSRIRKAPPDSSGGAAHTMVVGGGLEPSTCNACSNL